MLEARFDPAGHAIVVTAGEKFQLSEQRGKNVVIAFYPFAFTGT